MNSMTIDILNPKAKKLLMNLVDLDLIAIRETPNNGFSELLKKLRSTNLSKPSLEEITNEVELVRSRRYGKSTN